MAQEDNIATGVDGAIIMINMLILFVWPHLCVIMVLVRKLEKVQVIC